MKIKVGYTTKRDIKIFLDDTSIQQIRQIYLSLRQPNQYRYFYVFQEDTNSTTYKKIKMYTYKGYNFILSKTNKYKNIELYDAAEHTLAFDAFVLFYDLNAKRIRIQLNKDYVRALRFYISNLKKYRYNSGKGKSLTEEEYERIIKATLFQLKKLDKYMMIWNDTKKSICKHIQRERILFYTSIAKRKLSKVPKFDCHI